jgi:hypothetical protein
MRSWICLDVHPSVNHAFAEQRDAFFIADLNRKFQPDEFAPGQTEELSTDQRKAIRKG